jgi:hypothetical protein
VYSTDWEPNATLLKACGNRRVSVCPSCSATYQADSFQLLAAGLRGGKGLPERVARHPRLFVTFTAPSFGPVHSRRAQGCWCSPAIPTVRAPPAHMGGGWAAGSATTPTTHGWGSRCARAATRQAPRCCGTLWLGGGGRGPPSTCIGPWPGPPRDRGRAAPAGAHLLRQGGEYQKRGAVHFHAVIRLNTATACSCPGCVLPPPEEFSAGLLEQAVKEAAATVAVACPAVDGDLDVTMTARWGEQLDVRHITEVGDDDRELSAEQVAGYVAKYATKSTEALGVTLDHRIGEVELEGLDVPAHVAELVLACWELGGRLSLVGLRLPNGPWVLA